MKKLFTLIFLVSAVIPLGCTLSDESARTFVDLIEEYRNEPKEGSDGYIIRYPKGWFVEEDPEGLGFLIVSPQQDQEQNSYFLLSEGPKIGTPKDLADKLKTITQMGTPEARVKVRAYSHKGFDAARVDISKVHISAGVVVPSNIQGTYLGFPGYATEWIIDGPLTRFRIGVTTLESDRVSQEIFELMVENFQVLSGAEKVSP